MFPEVHKRAQKAGQPPGTLIYTGEKKQIPTKLTAVTYSQHDFHETSGDTLEACLPSEGSHKNEITWLNIEGLANIPVIESVAKRYDLHPLTVEDILNVQ